MDYAKEALKMHREWKGKLSVVPKMSIKDKNDLSIAYTPGVAQPCLEIQKDKDLSYELTRTLEYRCGSNRRYSSTWSW